jgi:UDPglucose 6-dehydrogenase
VKLTVIGSGYVGLVAGACFSSTGNDVTLVDIDQNKIEGLRRGVIPIFEPGLDDLVVENHEKGRLHFTTDLARAVDGADVVILAVGTPPRDDGSVDMTYINTAARQVGEALTDYAVIVTKSTVPVGTHKRIEEIVRAVTDVPFDYVSNPEFLKEGAAVNDFLKPDRVILGLEGDRPLKIMRQLYTPFMRQGERILVMDRASAELAKYACNAMLASRISFMNELARLCHDVGADIEHIRRGMGSDPRIGRQFLYPSLGYGGSCFPKDVQALSHLAKENGQTLRIVDGTHAANQQQRQWMLDRITNGLGGNVAGKKVAIWGTAFKANTDDVRESPAIDLISALVDGGATVSAYDPQAAETAAKALGDRTVQWATDMYGPLEGADALVVCTEWPEFRTPDFRRMAALMKVALLFDGRNLYDLEWVVERGFTYHSVGRPSVSP